MSVINEALEELKKALDDMLSDTLDGNVRENLPQHVFNMANGMVKVVNYLAVEDHGPDEPMSQEDQDRVMSIRDQINSLSDENLVEAAEAAITQIFMCAACQDGEHQDCFGAGCPCFDTKEVHQDEQTDFPEYAHELPPDVEEKIEAIHEDAHELPPDVEEKIEDIHEEQRQETVEPAWHQEPSHQAQIGHQAIIDELRVAVEKLWQDGGLSASAYTFARRELELYG
jgi:hypothetical protein